MRSKPLAEVEAAANAFLLGFSDEMQHEKIGLREGLRRGLRSVTYDRGRYSVRRENGVRHFDLLLREFLERT